VTKDGYQLKTNQMEQKLKKKAKTGLPNGTNLNTSLTDAKTPDAELKQ